MRRLTPIALCAVALAGCGGGKEDQGSPKGPVNPGQAVKRAGAGKTEPITVQGRAVPLGKTQVVLAGKRRSIVTLGDAAAIKKVGNGERLVVTGPLRRLDQRQASELAKEIDKGAKEREQKNPGVSELIARAPRKQGDPYLAAERIGPHPKQKDKPKKAK